MVAAHVVRRLTEKRLTPRQEMWLVAGLLTAMFAMASGILLLVWLTALRSSDDGLTTDTGARDGLFALTAVFLLGLVVRRLRLWNPRTIVWIPAANSAGFVVSVGLLFATDRLNTAWSLYGGLSLLRSDKFWSDLHYVLSWFECSLCEQWNPHYGPALAWLDPLTGGTLGLGWLAPLGALLSLIVIVCLLLVTRASHPLGRWVLVVLAASPAWLLLLDRGNLDALSFIAVVLLGLLVSRRPTIGSWTVVALVIWLLGTVKFYPFALGVTLLLALTVRRGWLVPVGFVTATFVYMVLSWETFQVASDWNSGQTSAWGTIAANIDPARFPAYGRIQLTELAGFATGSTGAIIFASILLALILLGAVWGWIVTTVDGDSALHGFAGILAFMGSIAFLGKVFIGGFAFLYSGAFLILVAPALVLPRRLRALTSSSYVIAALLMIAALFSAYNSVLATLAGLIVGGFGLGTGLRLSLLWAMQRERTRSGSAANRHDANVLAD